MGGGQSRVEEPKVVRMPNPNDPAILAAKERLLNAIKHRTGRSSTILSTLLKSVNGSGGLLGR
jgi:hypothetical protein